MAATSSSGSALHVPPAVAQWLVLTPTAGRGTWSRRLPRASSPAWQTAASRCRRSASPSRCRSRSLLILQCYSLPAAAWRHPRWLRCGRPVLYGVVLSHIARAHWGPSICLPLHQSGIHVNFHFSSAGNGLSAFYGRAQAADVYSVCYCLPLAQGTGDARYLGARLIPIRSDKPSEQVAQVRTIRCASETWFYAYHGGCSFMPCTHVCCEAA